jgi:hypothetical protein
MKTKGEGHVVDTLSTPGEGRKVDLGCHHRATARDGRRTGGRYVLEDVVTSSKRRRVSSWKVEHATPSIQNGSELGSPVQPGRKEDGGLSAQRRHLEGAEKRMRRGG